MVVIFFPHDEVNVNFHRLQLSLDLSSMYINVKEKLHFCNLLKQKIPAGNLYEY